MLWHNHWGFQQGDEQTTRDAMLSVFGWVREAQAAWPDGGVSSRYSLLTGRFLPPYPETTGYLVPTLLEVFRQCQHAEALTMARRAGEWLLTRQLASGAIDCSSDESSQASAADATVFLFDCGAILQAFVALHQHSQNHKWADAAGRLADFMIGEQLPDGSWKTRLYFPYFGSHQSLTGYALIEAGRALERERYVSAGAKCLDCTKPNILHNGYVRKCHFTQHEEGDAAFLHPLAYTVEGFLKSSRLLPDRGYLELIQPSLAALQRRFELGRSLLCSHYSEDWKPLTRYSALDADCQIAALWFQFGQTTGDWTYVSSALKLMDLMRTMIGDGSRTGSQGGIPGSFPVYGQNQQYLCTNWAPKYFIDASLLEIGARKALAA